jgi:hypothetical protein
MFQTIPDLQPCVKCIISKKNSEGRDANRALFLFGALFSVFGAASIQGSEDAGKGDVESE